MTKPKTPSPTQMRCLHALAADIYGVYAQELRKRIDCDSNAGISAVLNALRKRGWVDCYGQSRPTRHDSVRWILTQAGKDFLALESAEFIRKRTLLQIGCEVLPDGHPSVDSDGRYTCQSCGLRIAHLGFCADHEVSPQTEPAAVSLL